MLPVPSAKEVQLKDSTRYPEMRKWLSRTLAATATAVALVGVAVTAAAPAGSASQSPSGEAVTTTAVDHAATVAKARTEAALIEQRRIEELMGQGLSRPEANAQLLTEQKAAAKQNRLRILELATRGMTPQEIADATPGLVLASTGSTPISPLDSEEDLRLYGLTRYFYRQCGCDELVAEWEQTDDLQNGKDVVGIHVEESVRNLGGSVVHCDIAPNPDQCHTSRADREDAQGVAEKCKSEECEYGVIAFSAKQYSADGPGPCQMFAHYYHAWLSVSINGIGISTNGFSINWQYDKDSWDRQKAGPGVGC